MSKKGARPAKAEKIRPMLVKSKKKHITMPEGVDVMRAEHYTSGFCCPVCGSLRLTEHSSNCDAAQYAKEAGVTLAEYAKTPSLWCTAVSGWEDDEKVRCVMLGRPPHDGIHGFPTRITCLQAQKALGAVKQAEEEVQSKPKVQYQPQEDDMAKAKTSGKEAKAGKKGSNAALKKAQDANEGKRAELHAQKIQLLTKENPKREGTAAHKRFALYKNGMTVGEALEKGITMSDIRYNEEHGHLKLG